MRTSSNWTEAGTRATIALPVPVVARVASLPLLAIGVYLLRVLAGGVMHPADMTVAGWMVLPPLTAAFLLPGWTLLTMRKRVVVDAAARSVTDELDVIVYTRRARTHLPEQTHVLIRYEQGAAGDATTNPIYWSTVYLVCDQPVLIGMFRDSDDAAAAALAGQAARFLGVSVHDRRVAGGDADAGGIVVERLGSGEAD